MEQGIEDLKKYSEFYFFGTCIADLTRPEGALAAMRIFKALGAKVRFPAGQTCCGQPAYNSGFTDEARKVAQTQLKLFPDKIPIIVPSASCFEMFHEHYHDIFRGTKDEELVNNLVSRVYEWSWYLNRVMKPILKDKGKPVKIYCHTSCHGKKQRQDVFGLLSQLENVEVLQIPNAMECCGFGGAFSVKHTDISGQMANNKAQEIIESGAEILVSAESSCLLNIQGVLEKRGHNIPFYYLAEFILERIHAN